MFEWLFEDEEDETEGVSWRKKNFESTDAVLRWLNGPHEDEWTGWWGAMSFQVIPEKDGTFTVIYC